MMKNFEIYFMPLKIFEIFSSKKKKLRFIRNNYKLDIMQLSVNSEKLKA